MNRENTEELLNRYLNQQTSAEENKLIEQWLEDHKKSSAWDKMESADKNLWLTKKMDQINQSIEASAPKPTVYRKLNWRVTISAAAVIAIALLLYAQTPSLLAYWKADEMIVQVTDSNQKKFIVLADGSRVWLNKNSSLRYPKTFDGNTRTVQLSGEAYFDVQHDAKNTFIIRNGNITTTVLGTAFNIRENKSKNTIEVTVTRGKVSVANSEKTLAVLTPNQQLTTSKDQQSANDPVKRNINANEVIAWQQVDFHFDDILLSDAVARLSMHFGVNIRLADNKFKDCRFTGSNLAGQSLEEILKVICSFNNASYTKEKDGSILISGNGCN